MNIGEIMRSDNGKVSGYMAEAGFDFDFVFRKVVSDNPDAPGFDMVTRSPRGREVRLGSIWERATRETGEAYFAGYIDTAQSGFVPIRIFQSRESDHVWIVVRHVPRRRRQEREAINLPDRSQPDDNWTAQPEAETPVRKRGPRQAPVAETLAA